MTLTVYVQGTIWAKKCFFFFLIAGVTLALLNFRTGFSSDLHFQKLLLHHGKLLFLQVYAKKFKEFCLGVFCFILFFFVLCGRRAEEEGL